MRRTLILLLALLTLSACAAPAEVVEETPPPQEAPADGPAPEEPPEAEAPGEPLPSGHFVFLTQDAPLADGRVLRLEAVGRKTDDSLFGVREVRVYDGDKLLQTVRAWEAVEAEWGGDMAEEALYYTTCWSIEDAMEVMDLNFDGNMDFGLFGWLANNTIPYYYWTWDPEAEQYRYAFTLQGAEARPETEELTAEYKDGSAGARYVREFYKPDEAGALYLDRVEVENWENAGDSGQPGHEIWVPREGAGHIRPGGPGLNFEDDFVLTHQEAYADENQP